VVVEAEGQRRTRKTTPRSEWSSAFKKRIDGADIVRDVRFSDYTGVGSPEREDVVG
jgi:hypothetical protein